MADLLRGTDRAGAHAHADRIRAGVDERLRLPGHDLSGTSCAGTRARGGWGGKEVSSTDIYLPFSILSQF